jgi:telomerase reverse transcriptase
LLGGRLTQQNWQIVDFAVWLLFSRAKGGLWPKHLLCDGFRKHAGSILATSRAGTRCAIPGVFSVHPNYRVLALKESPWPELLLLLGQAGEQVMIDLLLDCAIFAAVGAGRGNLYQLSGVPISDLESLTDTRPASPAASRKPAGLPPSEITFMRSRMLYARAALNARGLLHFGLRHIRTSP